MHVGRDPLPGWPSRMSLTLHFLVFVVIVTKTVDAGLFSDVGLRAEEGTHTFLSSTKNGRRWALARNLEGRLSPPALVAPLASSPIRVALSQPLDPSDHSHRSWRSPGRLWDSSNNHTEIPRQNLQQPLTPKKPLHADYFLTLPSINDQLSGKHKNTQHEHADKSNNSLSRESFFQSNDKLLHLLSEAEDISINGSQFLPTGTSQYMQSDSSSTDSDINTLHEGSSPHNTASSTFVKLYQQVPSRNSTTRLKITQQDFQNENHNSKRKNQNQSSMSNQTHLLHLLKNFATPTLPKKINIQETRSDNEESFQDNPYHTTTSPEPTDMSYTHIQNCLEGSLCALLIAAGVSVGATGALAVPFIISGRKRRSTEYFVISRNNAAILIDHFQRHRDNGSVRLSNAERLFFESLTKPGSSGKMYQTIKDFLLSEGDISLNVTVRKIQGKKHIPIPPDILEHIHDRKKTHFSHPLHTGAEFTDQDMMEYQKQEKRVEGNVKQPEKQQSQQEQYEKQGQKQEHWHEQDKQIPHQKQQQMHAMQGQQKQHQVQWTHQMQEEFQKHKQQEMLFELEAYEKQQQNQKHYFSDEKPQQSLKNVYPLSSLHQKPYAEPTTHEQLHQSYNPLFASHRPNEGNLPPSPGQPSTLHSGMAVGYPDLKYTPLEHLDPVLGLLSSTSRETRPSPITISSDESSHLLPLKDENSGHALSHGEHDLQGPHNSDPQLQQQVQTTHLSYENPLLSNAEVIGSQSPSDKPTGAAFNLDVQTDGFYRVGDVYNYPQRPDLLWLYQQGYQPVPEPQIHQQTYHQRLPVSLPLFRQSYRPFTPYQSHQPYKLTGTDYLHSWGSQSYYPSGRHQLHQRINQPNMYNFHHQINYPSDHVTSSNIQNQQHNQASKPHEPIFLQQQYQQGYQNVQPHYLNYHQPPVPTPFLINPSSRERPQLKPETVTFFKTVCSVVYAGNVPDNEITRFIGEHCAILQYSGVL
ncbi:uncharacterized protein LOC122260441 [Penaeus japonicus]|uniref:uncharacterized protein LOC122260441 n=1 Tax=Penaeus japonicus TaxID=27405 RepID=UPI001C714D92|nr:uncharacterized protein LOC122260441 [Penaeus japonicus]